MKDGVIIGFLFGIFLTATCWIMICHSVEESKVQYGYLTFGGKRYQVVLYDKLDKPPKPEVVE